jgi:hypothetical protein
MSTEDAEAEAEEELVEEPGAAAVVVLWNVRDLPTNAICLIARGSSSRRLKSHQRRSAARAVGVSSTM